MASESLCMAFVRAICCDAKSCEINTSVDRIKGIGTPPKMHLLIVAAISIGADSKSIILFSGIIIFGLFLRCSNVPRDLASPIKFMAITKIGLFALFQGLYYSFYTTRISTFLLYQQILEFRPS